MKDDSIVIRLSKEEKEEIKKHAEDCFRACGNVSAYMLALHRNEVCTKQTVFR